MPDEPQTIDELLNAIRDEMMAGDEALTQDELDELWIAFFIEDAETNAETTRRLFATILQGETRAQAAEAALAAAAARSEQLTTALQALYDDWPGPLTEAVKQAQEALVPEQKPIGVAMTELRDAVGGAFDGVDADAFVRAQRDDEAPEYRMPDGRIVS